MDARVFILSLVTIQVCAGCSPRPASTEPDVESPQITLQVGNQSFSTEEGDGVPLDACAEIRRFPVQLSVAAADRGGGGIATVVVGALAGTIADVSVAPDTAATSLTLDRATHVLTITPRPPAGSVQPNLLATFTVDQPAAITVDAIDTSRNRAHHYQVDLRPAGDPVICRGETVP